MPVDGYITMGEAARSAGYVSTSTLKRAALSGDLQTVQASPRLRLTKPEWVADYLARHPRQGQTGKGARGRPRGQSRPRPEEEP
jgi:hypothetical protein